MRWQEIPTDRNAGTSASESCSGNAAGERGIVLQFDFTRADFTHRAVGPAVVAACRGNQAPGMNRFEQRDLPWIIALAIVVMLIVIVGIYSGGPAE